MYFKNTGSLNFQAYQLGTSIGEPIVKDFDGDGDGLENYIDSDDDGDGLATNLENAAVNQEEAFNADNDGIPY